MEPITAMADDAVHWINQLDAIDPEMPFLCYYVPGGTHAPHHPTPEWIKKISDMHLFDEGWNNLRETIFENQKRLGVIPADAKLTPWPHDILKNWDELSDVEKRLFIRQADVYAAYLAYTDHEIGRVVQAIEDLGKLDNTLVIYISGDNGASAEGTQNGTWNEMAGFNGVELTAEQLKFVLQSGVHAFGHCVLTSASVHDSQVAIPLMTMTGARVSYLYDLMDAAYDAAANLSALRLSLVLGLRHAL